MLCGCVGQGSLVGGGGGEVSPMLAWHVQDWNLLGMSLWNLCCVAGAMLRTQYILHWSQSCKMAFRALPRTGPCCSRKRSLPSWLLTRQIIPPLAIHGSLRGSVSRLATGTVLHCSAVQLPNLMTVGCSIRGKSSLGLLGRRNNVLVGVSVCVIALASANCAIN